MVNAAVVPSCYDIQEEGNVSLPKLVTNYTKLLHRCPSAEDYILRTEMTVSSRVTSKWPDFSPLFSLAVGNG